MRFDSFSNYIIFLCRFDLVKDSTENYPLINQGVTVDNYKGNFGSNTYFTFVNNITALASGIYTLRFFTNRSSINQKKPLFSKNNNNETGEQCFFINSENKLQFTRNTGAGTALNLVGNVVLDNNTSEVIDLVSDGTNTYFFINGTLDQVFNTSLIWNIDVSEPYIVGASLFPTYSSNNVYYNEVFNEVCIFNVPTQNKSNYFSPANTFFTKPYWRKVALQLKFIGNNNSTTFVDSSENLTITPIGGVKISTNKFKFNGSSGYFDGVDSALFISENELLNQSPLSFTLRFFIYPTANQNENSTIFSSNQTTLTSASSFVRLGSDLVIRLLVGSNSSAFLSSTVQLSVDQWSYVKITRHGTRYSLQINQTDFVYTTATVDVNFGVNGTLICKNGWQSNSFYKGYIAELEFISGFALESTSIPVVDYYYNSKLIEYMVLLMQFQKPEGSAEFEDETNNSRLITIGSGSPTISYIPDFNTLGALKLPNTGSWITANNPFLSFGTSDFTIYLYVKFVTAPTSVGLISNYPNKSFTTNTFVIGYSGSSNGAIALWVYNHSSTQPLVKGSSIVQAGDVTNIVISRIKSNFRLIINGILVGSGESSVSIDNGVFSHLHFGSDTNTATSGLNGYITKAFITIGHAVYFSNFIPSMNKLPDFPNMRMERFFDYDPVTLKLITSDQNTFIKPVNDTPNLSKDYWYGGPYKIRDRVLYNGIPASKKVSLFEKRTKQFLASTWSNPITGYYEFNNLKKLEYIVWSDDELYVYEPVTHLTFPK